MATPVSAPLQRSAPTADLKSVTCTLKHAIFATKFFVLPAVTPTCANRTLNQFCLSGYSPNASVPRKIRDVALSCRKLHQGNLVVNVWEGHGFSRAVRSNKGRALAP